MKLLHLTIIFAIVFILACGSNQIDNTLIDFSNDGLISVSELKKLEYKQAYKELWTNNEVDTIKVRNRLNRLNIFNVRFEKRDSVAMMPIFNIFLENSASMDGYVRGKTQFESSVYQFLSDINNNPNVSGKLNLNYINSVIIPHNSSVEDFIDKLEPITFKNKGGDIYNSDIKSILDSVVDKTTQAPETISIFISDCIFSLRNTNNVQEYLRNQSIGIKNVFTKKLQTINDLSVLVLQLNSQFNGIFYKYDNSKVLNLKKQRPYYIWIIGSDKSIKNLVQEIDLNQSLGDELQNYFMWSSLGIQPQYRISEHRKIGNYIPMQSNPLHGIKKPRTSNAKEQKGVFQFSIAVNLNSLALPNNYISNIENYKISDGSFEIVEIINTPKNLDYLNDYSHLIILKTKKIKTVNLSISLKQIFPEWINSLNWDPKSNTNKNEELNKTFGLKYLLEGVDKAFRGTKSIEKNFFTLNIEIEK